MELFISRLVATFISNDYTFQRAQREIKKKKNWNEASPSLLIITWLAACNTVALISILKKILGGRNSPFRFIIRLIRGCPLVHGGKLF